MTGELDGERCRVLGNSMAKGQESRLVRGKIDGSHVGLLALSCYLILDIGGMGGSRDHAPLSPTLSISLACLIIVTLGGQDSEVAACATSSLDRL